MTKRKSGKSQVFSPSYTLDFCQPPFLIPLPAGSHKAMSHYAARQKLYQQEYSPEAIEYFPTYSPRRPQNLYSTIVVVCYGKSRICFLLPSYTMTFATFLLPGLHCFMNTFAAHPQNQYLLQIVPLQFI